MTVPMITVLVRSSNERLISSMPNTIPASGVLKAAATPAAEPASMNPGWRCGANPAQRKHDRGADLHGRAFTPARGAAEKSEGQENNLAERDVATTRASGGTRRPGCDAPQSLAESRCPPRLRRRGASAASRAQIRAGELATARKARSQAARGIKIVRHRRAAG